MSRGTTATDRRPARRRWSELSQVEHVGLYTRQSLYFVLAATNVFLLLSIGERAGDLVEAAPLAVGGVVLTVVGCRALKLLLDHDPSQGPPTLRPVRPVAVLAVALAVAAALGWPDLRGAAFLVASVTVAMCVGVVPDDRAALAAVVVSGVLGFLHDPRPWFFVSGAFVALAFVVTGRASMWLFGIVRDLDVAREAQSELAVMEERLRFSRDVHDVLGRRLSSIAVQAELAATLAQRGDERAPEQMLEVRGVAHQALREARELARGYRATHVEQELEGARSLLRAAGIEVQLTVDAMPQAWHEPAGWVVREAVTNVLRHSGASRVEIVYGEGRLRIENDGARDGDPGDGAGLQGLRERLAPLGATLVAEARPGGRWSVVATFPGVGPLSSRTAAAGGEA